MTWQTEHPPGKLYNLVGKPRNRLVEACNRPGSDAKHLARLASGLVSEVYELVIMQETWQAGTKDWEGDAGRREGILLLFCLCISNLFHH